MGLLCLLLWQQVAVCAQVNISYTFEEYPGGYRPPAWGALPNLDWHSVGIINYSDFGHQSQRALGNWGQQCFTIFPDEGINYTADSVWMFFWYALDDRTTSIDVGYLTDATDSNTFHSLALLHDMGFLRWHFAAVDLSSVPVRARIAMRARDIVPYNDAVFYIDDILLTSQPCAAWGLRVAENRADSVRLEWNTAGYPQVRLNSSFYPSSIVNSLTIPHISDNTFNVTMQTVGGGSPTYQHQYMSGYTEQVPVYPYREGSCLDAVDYQSTMAVPYYGTYTNPYMHTGTRTISTSEISGTPLTGVNNGSHTLNYTAGWETQAGSVVFWQCIPPGDSVSLRLGNRTGISESSSMLYTIDVDTAEADLLVMKYTVAMATIDHFSSTDQSLIPRARHADTLHPAWFAIELLDDTLGQLQPEACNRVDLNTYSPAGSWDEDNTYFRRRNFTAAPFDLRPWHGRRVHLRVTATSGAVFNRWCYGYYTFECLKRTDAVGSCEADSMTLEAPYGFRYQWWRDGMYAVVDTARSITVAADGTLWHCDLIDRFNPACTHTISRRVLPGPYVEVRDTVVENDLPHTWGGIVFTGPADTVVTVSAAIGCDTMVHYMLHVWPNRHVRRERGFCPGEWPVVWDGHTFYGPDSVTVTFTDSHGADSTVTLIAFEAPTYEVFDTVVICPASPFVYDGIDYGGPAVFDIILATVDGCDSLLHIALLPRDSAFSLRAFHSTDRRLWSDTVPIVLCNNQTLYVVDSTVGSAAWLWTLSDTADVASRQAEFDFVRSDSVVGTGIRLVATSHEGCSDTLEWPVLVFPAPVAAFAWDPARPADMAPEVQFINYSQPEDCRWLWTIENTDGGADTLTGFAPFYRWNGTLPQGDMSVSLATSLTKTALLMDSQAVTHTCTDTATQAVTIVTSYLEFPNLVTPNGDGINDRWEVVNLVEMGLYPVNEVWIYNQWGVLVLHARDIRRREDFWNPDDLPCPDGTYYFRFLGKSPYGVVRRNGVIEVLR